MKARQKRKLNRQADRQGIAGGINGISIFRGVDLSEVPYSTGKCLLKTVSTIMDKASVATDKMVGVNQK